MKIAIIVHGRFHAFDLARELIRKGHEITVMTNYPNWAARRFGIPSSNIRSLWPHGVLSRISRFFYMKFGLPYPEALLHRIFGSWAAKEVMAKSYDVVHSWSGVSEEVFEALKDKDTLKILARGSAHIRYQARLLEDEEKRTGIPIERPTEWMIAREEREYELADYIRILSKFSYRSFLEEGVDARKLLLIPSGTPIGLFRPTEETVEKRYERIKSGQPLRVLYVGALALRKGMFDMVKMVERLDIARFKIRLVGPMEKDAENLLKKIYYKADIVPKKPQTRLPAYYAWADIFVFPTIQDGYAQVLAQAQASALPVLSTANCAAPDFIVEGGTGWVLPIRSPDAFINRLLWCDEHRNELARIAEDIYKNFKPRSWSRVAEDFASTCARLRLSGREVNI